jgi:hypothetical protein
MSKFSTPVRITLLAAALTMAAPALGQAAPGALSVGYTMAFWGIPFGHTDYDGTLGTNSYTAKAHFETSGLVSIFWKSTIDTTVNGAIGAHSIQPAIYDSYAQDRDKPMERVKVTFGAGAPVTLAEPAYDTTTYPVSDEQKKEAVDPMSAITSIIAGVRADAKNPCGTGARIFDGRRRYDVVFTYLKDEPVQLDNKLFNGTAHLCQIHYNQIAGYKQKIIKEGRELPPMFADFADVNAAGAPNGRYVVAVKLWSSLSYGTVSVTLNNLKVDGAPPPGFAAKS